MTRRVPEAALLLLGLALLAPAPSWAQCAMCQTTLTGSAEGRAIGAQFNSAILVMLAGPYLVFAGFLVAAFAGRIAARFRRAAHALRAHTAARLLSRAQILPR